MRCASLVKIAKPKWIIALSDDINASRNYHPSSSSIVDIYFVRNFPDKDFLPITRGAFYQRLSMVNSIKIRRTEMTASVRVRTTRRTGGP